MHQGNLLHFQDVVHACAKRVLQLAAVKDGKDFDELPATHAVRTTSGFHSDVSSAFAASVVLTHDSFVLCTVQVVQKWQTARERASKPGAAGSGAFETQHVYSALTILDTFRTYRFRRCSACQVVETVC